MNRMLKGMSHRAPEDGGRDKDEKIKAMQAQLEELKKMKVLRLSRIEHRETKYGLLDSGATHPMRGRMPGEDITGYEKVKVTLADGGQVEMRMTETGIMVLDQDEVEPILPMGAVAGPLGYDGVGRWKDEIDPPTEGRGQGSTHQRVLSDTQENGAETDQGAGRRSSDGRRRVRMVEGPH